MGMKLAHRLVPGIVAGSLLLGGASGALAAKGKRQGRVVSLIGQVSNLSTTGFTLTAAPRKAAAGATTTAAPKTFQVILGATTKEKALRGTTGTLTNGEYALVVGRRSKAGVTARRVLFSTTARDLRRILHVAIGTIAAGTTSTSLVITTRKGKSVTFAITPATKFRVGKATQTVAPALTAGQKVAVRFGRVKGSTALVARAIRIRAAPAATATQP